MNWPQFNSFAGWSGLDRRGRPSVIAGRNRNDCHKPRLIRSGRQRETAACTVPPSPCPSPRRNRARFAGTIRHSQINWVDRAGTESPIAFDDLLIIAPYNAEVFALQERIPGARIGTVDKFQVRKPRSSSYSMSTSSHADAPRGMEFLYSANRLNVATWRAQCLCIVVASSRLFEAECRTPRQMQLASAFCRYWSWRRL